MEYPDQKQFESGMFESIFYPERTRMKQKMLMDAVQSARKEEEWNKEQEYISPIQKAFARRYFKENPSEVGEFQGIPGIGMEAQQAKAGMIAEGTGGQAKTSQGVNVPSTYTPPEAQDSTVKMTGSGFKPMSLKEQVMESAAKKYMAGEATTKEKKMLGIEKEEKFRDELQKAIGGEISYEALIKKRPDKRKEITNTRVNQIQDSSTRGVAQGILKEIYAKQSTKDVDFNIEEVIDQVNNPIQQLLDNKEAYEKKGINVDEILEALDVKKSQIKEKKFKEGNIYDVSGRGKWKYLGKDKWEQAE